ncbi:cytidylate kinase [Variibacter gotjawalensis]|uniref:Cytidylate kinase n=1 Tax=Variibacter gotjawalensis TaxID=1333996 RepID=A0A0S3Q172_9BRAD|nr:(d)CMP kinase [Variibacter gotjawalensis]NIK47552.1 cytidylate kinase [Variibacter gotjawalensis]RZS49449.1 cytidylate kinase [Variibacter gotjawalensis]BAT61712.1 cytidylate kinase [Variibacter gotjawalensis]
MIIAIDGPAASGKGTLSKKLAAQYGLPHLDTGLLYRGVAKSVIDNGAGLQDRTAAEKAAKSLNLASFDEISLKSHQVGDAASVVSAYPEVRAALVDLQHRFAAQPKGAVIDGRDIGTVICPNAEVKIFVTASPEARAERRVLELRGRGEAPDAAKILADILARDERDRNRAASPLIQADDAHLLDTTHLSIDAAFQAAIDIVEAVRAGRRA